tara:strand:- start:436 stop:2154 length:1719 start_codon:yes stop_codon:yes gene_type:complete
MSSDLVVYNQSIEEKPVSSVMTDKKWLNVIDQNNGSYQSGQSTLETTSLSTSDRFMNYREAYLAIPVLLTVGNSSDDTNGFDNLTNRTKTVGLKNSYTTLIHSMSVDLNGTNIIQSTPFSEFYNAFNLLTCLSWEDVKTQGSTIGFYPDDALSATSFIANNLAGGSDATVNNQDLLTPNAETGAVVGKIGNIGFNERLKYINYNADAEVNGENGVERPQSAFLTKGSADTLFKSQVYNIATSAGGSPIIQTQVMAIVKLRHLHNFFNNVPLSKGLQFRFIINFNQSTITQALPTNTTGNETIVKSQFGGVSPIMLASHKAGNGGAGFTNNAGSSIRADLSIGRKCLDNTLSSRTNQSDSSLPQSLSLYVPSYVMNSSLEASYVSANSAKRISYSDIYQFKITDVTTGTSFNQLITSGIRGVRSVVVMPMFPAGSNGGGVPEWQSAQSCCGGGTTALLAQITDFQVQVGGVNQIQTNGRYEFEIFNNYVYGANSVNGGLTDGLSSGLVGQADWGRKYLYYYIDCNRGTDLERDTPKSIQVQGRNLSAKTVDYYVFVEFENSFSIDVGTGAIQP